MKSREVKMEAAILIGEARVILTELLEVNKKQLEALIEIKDLLKNGNPAK